MTHLEIEKREPNMQRASGSGSYYFTVVKYGQTLKIHTHDSEFWDNWTNCEYKSREYYGMARRIIKRFVGYKIVK